MHTIEADLIVVGTEWIGIGFSLSATGGYRGHGQVWTLLKPTGHWSALANGLQHVLGTGQARTFSPTGLNRVALHLDRVQNEVWIEINGETVLAGFPLNDLRFSPSLAFAGVHIQTAAGSPGGQATVDNFRILSGPGIAFSDGFVTGTLTGWSTVCSNGCG